MKRILAICLLLGCVLALASCNTDATPDGMQNVALESAKYNLYVPENWIAGSYNVSGARVSILS